MMPCIFANYFHNKPSLFIHSPYLRTAQTGQPLFNKFPDVPKEEWPIQEYTYLPHKDYYQTTTMQRHPQARKYFRYGDPNYITGEGAESFNQFRERVKESLYKLSRLDSDFTVIFGHGWFMRAILWEKIMAEGLSKKARRHQWNLYKEKLNTSPIPFILYTLFGLRGWKKTMHNFLLFSSAILVQNGTILKFSVNSSKEINLMKQVDNHIPTEIKGSNWVDR